jgi:hypothetical protein
VPKLLQGSNTQNKRLPPPTPSLRPRPLVTPHHTSGPALPVSSSCPCPLARPSTTARERPSPSRNVRPRARCSSSARPWSASAGPRPQWEWGTGTKFRHRNRQPATAAVHQSVPSLVSPLHKSHGRRRVSPTPISPIIRSLASVL